MALNLAFARNKEESLVHVVFPFCLGSIWILLLVSRGAIAAEEFASAMTLTLSLALLASLFFFVLRPIEFVMMRFARIVELEFIERIAVDSQKLWEEIVRPVEQRLQELYSVKSDERPPDYFQKQTRLLEEHGQARKRLLRRERRLLERRGERSPLFNSPLFSHTRNRLNLAGYLTLAALAGAGLSFLYSLDGWTAGVVLGVVYVGLAGSTGWKWRSEIQDMPRTLTIIADFYEALERADQPELDSLFTACRLAIEIEDWQGAQTYLTRLEEELGG